jgi:hypothetical protein
MVIRHSPIVVEIFSTCFTMPWLLYHMQCAIILASAIYFLVNPHDTCPKLTIYHALRMLGLYSIGFIQWRNPFQALVLKKLLKRWTFDLDFWFANSSSQFDTKQSSPNTKARKVLESKFFFDYLGFKMLHNHLKVPWTHKHPTIIKQAFGWQPTKYNFKIFPYCMMDISNTTRNT